MIANKTYNNVIDTLKALGEKHNQIKTTTVGDIFDIDLEQNTLYPLMHLNPLSVNTRRTELVYNFQVLIMDLVNDDNSNEQEVYSDVLQMCVDVISILTNSKWQAQLQLDIDAPVYFAEGDYTIEPFTERFNQAVTGWVFTISVVVENTFQTCNIPMTDEYIGQ